MSGGDEEQYSWIQWHCENFPVFCEVDLPYIGQLAAVCTFCVATLALALRFTACLIDRHNCFTTRVYCMSRGLSVGVIDSVCALCACPPEDAFNLYGIRDLIKNFKEAMRLIRASLPVRLFALLGDERWACAL